MVSKTELRQLVDAAKRVDFSDPSERLSIFVARTLGLNAMQMNSRVTASDLVEIAANLTFVRGKELFRFGRIPNFVVHRPAGGDCEIAGLGAFLQIRGVKNKVTSRLMHREAIRKRLREMEKGHYLEALAAAVLDTQMHKGFATQGSGDQGIDAIGWSVLFRINEAVVEKDNQIEYAPDAKVFAFSSAKKSEDTGLKISLISPAVIRELIGGWAIQRSVHGAWNSHGVKMLSPIQMLFVTTYRLSDPSRSLCKSLGVQVWGLPELVFLVAENSPDNVFDSSQGETFVKSEFDKWWKVYHDSRVLAN